MDKLKKLEEEIKILQKEKEKEELRIEIEQLKKTKVKEITIERHIIQEYPTYPYIYNGTTSPGANLEINSDGNIGISSI